MRYARPETLDEAFALLAARRAPDRRRHRPRWARSTAASSPPALLVDLQAAGLGGITRDGDGAARSAPTATLADARGGGARRALPAVATAAAERGVAAAAQRRHGRRQPLPGHALLVLPRARVALLARRRRHLLRADRRPPQAQPRAGRLHLGAPVRPRARPGAPAARPSPCASPAASASCRCSSSTGGRPRTTARCSTLAPGELVVEVRLPAPPDGVDLRARRRAPGVLVPARVRGRGARAAAASGSSPPAWRTSRASSTRTTRCAGLAGNPQTGWKRHLLATLVDPRPEGHRMIATVAGRRPGLSLRLAEAARGVVGPPARGARASTWRPTTGRAWPWWAARRCGCDRCWPRTASPPSSTRDPSRGSRPRWAWGSRCCRRRSRRR